MVDDDLLGRQDATAEHAALAVNVLGRRIDDDVGAELERALVERRREHVVDDELGAGRVRDLGHRGDVVDLQGRIGRRLHEEHLGVLRHRLLPLVDVLAVDQREGDAEAREPFLDHPAAGAEQGLRRDHMVAQADEAHQRGRHRRHAGRGRTRGLGAFERGHAALEHAHGRVRIARIDVARDFAGKARLAIFCARVEVALRQEQGFRHLAELRAQRAGVHQAGLGAVILLRRRHAGLLPACTGEGLAQATKNRPEKNLGRAALTRPRPFSELFYVAASRPAQMTTG